MPDHNTKFLRSLPAIANTLDALGVRCLGHNDLRNLFQQMRSDWKLYSTLSFSKFLDLMLEHSPLHEETIPLPHRKYTRYCWRDAGILDVVQSITTRGYFSHFTAMHLNGLTLELPKTIYFNVEQSKRPGGGELNQAALNRAFAAKARTTKNVVSVGQQKVCLLEGGNTDSLGVVDMKAPSPIRVTNVERTLIDATVRPNYSGGIYEVVKAYHAAKDSVSINRLVAYLKRIGYTYPYHQAIGFYLTIADYPREQISLVERIPRKFDFFLDYAIKSPEFDSHWRITFPKGLKDMRLGQ